MQRRTMLRSLLASPFVAPSASHRSDGASDGETGKSTSASVIAAPTVFDVMVYGARGDGEADDRSAIAAADRAARAVRGTVYFPDAVGYRIGASITVGSPLHFSSGATLRPDSNATVTIAGPVSAPPVRIFGGPGTIRFGPGSTPEVLLNWFARGDAAIARGCSMTRGSALLTRSAGAPFTASDVGKRIVVVAAGSSQANLVTTITRVQSAEQVTLASNAGSTVERTLALFASDGQAEIQQAVNAVSSEEVALNLVVPIGNFLVESTVTISAKGGMGLFFRRPAQFLAAVYRDAYAFHMDECHVVHALFRGNVYSGNGIKIGDPSANSGKNFFMAGTELTGPGRSASKPAPDGGTVGLHFAAAKNSNYFNHVERPILEGFDRLVVIDGGGRTNGQVVVDPHVERYWYAFVINGQENEIRGGFAHNAAGAGGDKTEVFRIGRGASWNKIDGMMAEPSSTADAWGYVIEAGAHTNDIRIRSNVSAGNVDNSRR